LFPSGLKVLKFSGGRVILVAERGFKGFLKRRFFTLLKAVILTTAMAFFLLLVWWFVILKFSGDFPQVQGLFETLAAGLLLFTFVVKASEGTIYKFVFLVGRAFFLIFFFVYATNGGVFNFDFEKFRFMVEFEALLALMIFTNILDMARSVLQAFEFSSEGPKE